MKSRALFVAFTLPATVAIGWSTGARATPACSVHGGHTTNYGGRICDWTNGGCSEVSGITLTVCIQVGPRYCA